MRYYGVVEKIKKEHKPGIYGRRKYTETEIKEIQSTQNSFMYSTAHAIISPITYLATVALGSFFYKKATKELTLQHEDKHGKCLIFDSLLFENDYNIANNSDLFYGLFDKYTLKNSVFEALLKSKGGSQLVIIAREDLPSFMHYGGKSAKFNTGIYCTHPKRDDILLPIENSIGLLKNMILEETLRAYEALGAKKIIIHDLTDIKSKSKTGSNGIIVNANYDSKIEILREKVFGKGVFDPERALQDSVFIHDLPNVITTINGRIYGNQLIEKFTENVNLSAGLDITVIDKFSSGANYSYERSWSIEVEFYDKNEIEIIVGNNSLKNIDNEYILSLIEKIKVLFRSNTLSQIDLGLGKLSNDEISILTAISAEYKKTILNELCVLSLKDGVVTEKEIEFILSICDKLELDTEEVIDQLSANYTALLHNLKDKAIEVDDLLSLVVESHKIEAQFYKNNRVFIFDLDNNMLAQGSYSNGAKKIILDDGRKSESPSIEKNITDLLKP